MKRKTLFMETTAINVNRTVAEVMELLVQMGASQIAVDYDKCRISGLRWTMQMNSVPVLFHLPARVAPIYRHLASKRTSWRRNEQAIKEQAERVAWRQLYRWVQAQAAMVETEMVEAVEVFLPYADWGGRPLFASLKESGMKMLPAPK